MLCKVYFKVIKITWHLAELIEKAKKALAEKRKEELNFLKQQMEDAIHVSSRNFYPNYYIVNFWTICLQQRFEDNLFAFQRKEVEKKQATEEDNRMARASSRYEVTTAKIDEEIAEQARSYFLYQRRFSVIHLMKRLHVTKPNTCSLPFTLNSGSDQFSITCFT